MNSLSSACTSSHSVLFGEWLEVQALLKLFILEKTLYELRYEMTHRPDWVAIPAGGLRALFPVLPPREPALQAGASESRGQSAPADQAGA